VAVAEQIDDLALGFVAPLQADDTGARHKLPRSGEGSRLARPGHKNARSQRLRAAKLGGIESFGLS
jgi:hypothetical protein